MGPKLFGKKDKKNETEYCLRAIPIGGFVSLAGEEVDDDSKIPKERKLYETIDELNPSAFYYSSVYKLRSQAFSFSSSENSLN